MIVEAVGLVALGFTFGATMVCVLRPSIDKPRYTIVAGDWRAVSAAVVNRAESAGATYVPAGIRCDVCGLTSWNPMDVAERYCANCHIFHEAGRGAGERL